MDTRAKFIIKHNNPKSTRSNGQAVGEYGDKIVKVKMNKFVFFKRYFLFVGDAIM